MERNLLLLDLLVVLLALLSPGAQLAALEGPDAYSSLSELYKKGVDLALQQVNSLTRIQQRFLFFKTLTKSETEAGFGTSYIYHNFYIKATKCSRSVVEPNPNKCPFRSDRPLIDCAVCYRTVSGDVAEDPKPYIHCVHKPALTGEAVSKRVEHCKTMSYSHGSPTLLASKGQK
ncbi:uncharacterized protein LOC110535652 [Arapaima gigas]